MPPPSVSSPPLRRPTVPPTEALTHRPDKRASGCNPACPASQECLCDISDTYPCDCVNGPIAEILSVLAIDCDGDWYHNMGAAFTSVPIFIVMKRRDYNKGLPSAMPVFNHNRSLVLQCSTPIASRLPALEWTTRLVISDFE